jgi:hypothetical protein
VFNAAAAILQPRSFRVFSVARLQRLWQHGSAAHRCLRYSFYPDEAEVLVSPNARFFVASQAALEVPSPPPLPTPVDAAVLQLTLGLQSDGYYHVELIEKRGEGVVF